MGVLRMSDRTVHAHYPGMEIVRYDRAGKWYLEPTEARLLSAQQVTLDGAVRAALWGVENGGEVFMWKPGGGAFDARVKRLLADPGPPATAAKSARARQEKRSS